VAKYCTDQGLQRNKRCSLIEAMAFERYVIGAACTRESESESENKNDLISVEIKQTAIDARAF
jgi:hypothetical protein